MERPCINTVSFGRLAIAVLLTAHSFDHVSSISTSYFAPSLLRPPTNRIESKIPKLHTIRDKFMNSCSDFENFINQAGDANRLSSNQMMSNMTEWITTTFLPPKSTLSYSIADTIKLSNVYMASNAAWDFMGVENDVSVWKLKPSSIPMKHEDKQWPCIKSTAIVKGDAKMLVEYLMDSSKVPEYNKHCAGRTDVEKISKKSKIVWNRTKIPLAIKSYDFCTLMHYYQKPNKEYILVSKGVDHPLIPVHKDYSRSENIIGINILRTVPSSLGAGKGSGPYTEITCINHVRYGGTLPYVIQKSIFRGTVKYLHNLKEKLKN